LYALLRQARLDAISLGLQPGDTVSPPSPFATLVCVLSSPRAGYDLAGA